MRQQPGGGRRGAGGCDGGIAPAGDRGRAPGPGAHGSGTGEVHGITCGNNRRTDKGDSGGSRAAGGGDGIRRGSPGRKPRAGSRCPGTGHRPEQMDRPPGHRPAGAALPGEAAGALSRLAGGGSGGLRAVSVRAAGGPGGEGARRLRHARCLGGRHTGSPLGAGGGRWPGAGGGSARYPPAPGDRGGMRVLRGEPLRAALRRVPGHDGPGRTWACGGAGGGPYPGHSDREADRGQKPDTEMRGGNPLPGQTPEGCRISDAETG